MSRSNVESLTKELCKRSLIPMGEIAEILGVSPASLSNRLNDRSETKDLGCGFVAQVLDVVGYRLVVVPKEEPLPKKHFEVTPK